MRILVAEDNSTSRFILERTLSKWGHEIVSVADGIEAWEKLKADDTPKLAILDWMMPGLDGIEICRRLRQIDAAVATYVILLTAKNDKKDIIRGLNAGADDYIVKPYDYDELRARINVGRRVIELRKTLAEKEKMQGVLEMAGAICHELNQPLMAISGYSELLLMDMPEDKLQHKSLKKIKEQVDRVGNITRKLMCITRYKTKSYLNKNIVDINAAVADKPTKAKKKAPKISIRQFRRFPRKPSEISSIIFNLPCIPTPPLLIKRFPQHRQAVFSLPSNKLWDMRSPIRSIHT